jgi:hypothetical protein
MELVRKRYWSKKYPICLTGVKQLNIKFNANKNDSISTSTSSIRLSSNLSRNFGNISSSSPASQRSSVDLEDDELNSASVSLPPEMLVLFARTDREKEEWFNLFKKSSSNKLADSIHYLKQSKTRTSHNKAPNVNLPSSLSAASVSSLNTPVSNSKFLDFNEIANISSTDISGSTSKIAQTQTENSQMQLNSSITFMNTFLIRLFADFFTHKQWIDFIQNKIQNKLSKIKVPSFMEELTITGIDLGSVVPLIKQVNEPWYDEKGLWVHLEIDYSGGFNMSLATKLNLMKLRTKSTINMDNISNSTSFSFKNNRENEEGSISIISSSSSSKVTSSKSTPIDINDSSSLNNSKNDNVDVVKRKNSNENLLSKSGDSKSKNRKHLAIVDSNEEDSPESSGDEYTHTSRDEENKLVET